MKEEITIALEVTMILNDHQEYINMAYTLCNATITLDIDDRVKIVTRDHRVFYLTVESE